MVNAKLFRWLLAATAFFAVYLFLAYVVLPGVWRHYENQPGLEHSPAVTTTPSGIPGDPLNAGLVGSREEVVRAMQAGGWYPADPVTLKSAIEIAGSVVLGLPYPHAPISPLLYDGRRQDLAFELPIGGSADKRHHVRFWRVLDKGAEDRPVWLGAATRDARVGINEYNGQATHHIEPDVDAERDFLIDSIVAARRVTTLYKVAGVGPTLNGRNGEGDRYTTDGEIRFAVLTAGAQIAGQPPVVRQGPAVIELKDRVWRVVSGKELQ